MALSKQVLNRLHKTLYSSVLNVFDQNYLHFTECDLCEGFDCSYTQQGKNVWKKFQQSLR